MAASMTATVLRHLRKSCSVPYARAGYYVSNRCFSTTNDADGNSENESQKNSSNHIKTTQSISAGESALSGFARALEKFSEKNSSETDHDEIANEENEPFSTMLRKSKLMQIGETSGRTVLGTIIESVGDDLYIDIGGKFHCVCQRPNFQPETYHRGVRVKVRLNDLEMTSAFLGSDTHITLQEADGTLIGIHRSSRKQSGL